MSNHSRRGFLRGLTTLPLIGGGVTLIGSPTAVAEPVTDRLFDAYLGFIVHKHREILAQHSYRKAVARAASLSREGVTMPAGFPEACAQDTRELPYLQWVPKGSDAVDYFCRAACPTTRAALVLSAVGYDWRQS
ncbi:hypothetical protein MPPM_4771 [Methylorubrum populi]|uniref:Uncharacterized protein n=1 Tax=Methylorubrum populi TaxID=223967 RepID=A0A160PJZ2_9HYPH|nr:hypothetical protein [Methylorubrum populi]BAU93376.1 hypothetical protein MPPM_4771 [Methylorubrum populi]